MVDACRPHAYGECEFLFVGVRVRACARCQDVSVQIMTSSHRSFRFSLQSIRSMNWTFCSSFEVLLTRHSSLTQCLAHILKHSLTTTIRLTTIKCNAGWKLKAHCLWSCLKCSMLNVNYSVSSVCHAFFSAFRFLLCLLCVYALIEPRACCSFLLFFFF